MGSDTNPNTRPNYAELVTFLIQPFLEDPTTLKIDCETSHNGSKIWVRVAFDSAEKGRVFGRGGRNIQAVRTVLGAAANMAGQVVHLDVFGSSGSSHDDEGHESSHDRRPPRSGGHHQRRRPPGDRPKPPQRRN